MIIKLRTLTDFDRGVKTFWRYHVMVGEPSVTRLDSVMALLTLEYGASATLLFDLFASLRIASKMYDTCCIYNLPVLFKTIGKISF
jgi:hypothetical protein